MDEIVFGSSLQTGIFHQFPRGLGQYLAFHVLILTLDLSLIIVIYEM